MQRAIKNTQNSKSENGYILIELVVVFVILGFLLTATLPLYESYKQRNAVSETKERIEIIAKAISAYTQIRWRLPCPAKPAVTSENQLGVERAACNTVDEEDAHGIIPYRTLGIPEQYAKDGYGNFFTYIVSPDFTADTRLGIAADEVNIRLAHLVAGGDADGNYALLPSAQFCAPITNSGRDIDVEQDGVDLYVGDARTAIRVPRTRNPDPNLNREEPVTGIALAIISHGANGSGAYQSSGAQSAALNPGSPEELTSNNENRRVVTQSSFDDTGTDEYDDIVDFFTQDEIYALAGRQSCEHL